MDNHELALTREMVQFVSCFFSRFNYSVTTGGADYGHARSARCRQHVD